MKICKKYEHIEKLGKSTNKFENAEKLEQIQNNETHENADFFENMVFFIKKLSVVEIMISLSIRLRYGELPHVA